MTNRKRILSITIKRMYDKSPDTSWLGEYASRAISEYSIDRAHSEDCIENDSIQKAKLERIADWIENEIPNCEAHPDFFSMDCATCDVEAAYKDAETTVRELLVCDCGEHGDMRRNEYRYFNPSLNYVDKSGHLGADYKDDPNGPATVRGYVRQDYERMESLNAGNWCFIGIRAEAEIRYPYMTEGRGGRTYFKTDVITSDGLYGIESDAGDDHIKSTIQEELSQLKAQLLALGVSKRAIATAFKEVQESDI